MKSYWSKILFIIIITDALVTMFIGKETNPIILNIMNLLNINLNVAMILKVMLSIPLIYILDKYNYSKLTSIIYLIIYAIITSIQIV
jgi:hypothetical protein